MRKKVLFFSFLLMFLMGCAALAKSMGYVPQEELAAAQDELAAAEVELVAARDQNAGLAEEKGSLETEVADLQGSLTSLETQLADWESQNAELAEEKGSLETELAELLGNLDGLETHLADWESLLCPGHTWGEAMTAKGSFPFQGVLDYEPFGRYVFFTQWQQQAGNIEGAAWTTLLWDVDGEMFFVIDTENNCLLINPEYSDCGK